MRIILFFCAAAICLSAAAADLETELESFIASQKAQIGVAVALPGGERLSVNNDSRYPMMSVMKLHQAMAVADMMERKGLPLSTTVFVSRDDLQPDTYSPLRDRRPEGNFDMTVARLLDYSLQLSDNNACDILFRFAGGTETVDSYIRSLGIDSCEVKLTERQMHLAPEESIRNWSSPEAAVELLETLRKEAASRQLFAQIVATISECETGLNRLPAAIGKDDTISHKTGTGGTDSIGRLTAVNDIGFVRLSDGRVYSIAVFVKDSARPFPETEKMIAEISRIVYRHVKKR